MVRTEHARPAGAPCERCGGQAFWTETDVPMPWRDYRELICIQCGHVVEARWRETGAPVLEAPRRGRPARGEQP